jgi:hypothetical protein
MPGGGQLFCMAALPVVVDGGSGNLNCATPGTHRALRWPGFGTRTYNKLAEILLCSTIIDALMKLKLKLKSKLKLKLLKLGLNLKSSQFKTVIKDTLYWNSSCLQALTQPVKGPL